MMKSVIFESEGVRMAQSCQATVFSRKILGINTSALLRLLLGRGTRGGGSPHRVARCTGIDVTPNLCPVATSQLMQRARFKSETPLGPSGMSRHSCSMYALQNFLLASH